MYKKQTMQNYNHVAQFKQIRNYTNKPNLNTVVHTNKMLFYSITEAQCAGMRPGKNPFGNTLGTLY